MARDFSDVLIATYVPHGGASGSKAALEGLLAELTAILEHADRTRRYAAVVLASEHPGFLPEPSDAGDTVARLQDVLLAAATPVVAVLDGGAKDTVWLLAQHCDACIYGLQGLFSFSPSTSPWRDPNLSTASRVFSRRFGNQLAKEVILAGRVYRGTNCSSKSALSALPARTRCWRPPWHWQSPGPECREVARRSWKQELRSGDHTAEFDRSTEYSSIGDESAPATGHALGRIPLHSKVITATSLEGGIVVARLEDREAKNMFSDALVRPARGVYAHRQQARL